MITRYFPRLMLALLLSTGSGSSLASAQAQDDVPVVPVEQAGQIAAGPLKPDSKSINDLPPEVLARLSPTQIIDVLKQREKTKVALRSSNDVPAVAIVVPVAMFLMVIAIVALILRFRSTRDERLHDTMQKMIEKGVEIPPALILPPMKKDADLRKGLVYLGAGLAITNALYSIGSEGAWSLGLIPVLMGLAYLAVWRLTRTSSQS